MTSAEFANRYKLLKCVTERGARTYLAQQLSLGRVVMAHFLDEDAAGVARQSLARLEELPPTEREKVLEVTDVEGIPVVITLFMPGFENLPAWLERHAASATAVRAPLAASARAMDPDAPTQIMEVPSLGVPPHQPSQAAPSPVAANPPGGVAAPAAGSFTSAFGVVVAPERVSPTATRAPAPAPTPAASTTPAAAQGQPGEFTRMFEQFATDAAPPAPVKGSVPLPLPEPPPFPPQVPEEDPQRAPPRETPPLPFPPPPIPPPPLDPSIPVSAPAGPLHSPPSAAQPPAPSFTAMFGAAGAPSAAPAPVVPHVPPPAPPPFAAPTPLVPGGGVSSVMPLSMPPPPPMPPPLARPPIVPAPAMSPLSPPPPLPLPGGMGVGGAVIAGAAGPSEFTRVLGRVSPQAPAALPPMPMPPAAIHAPPAAPVIPPASAAPAGPQRSMVPMLVAIIVLLVIALALVVIVAI